MFGVVSVRAVLPFAVESWADYRIRFFMDGDGFKKYQNSEHALVLLNHRGDLDWMIGWVLIERSGMLGGAKAYMKDIAKFIPGLGWSFIFMEYPILTRDWEKDKHRLKNYCQTLKDYPVNMLLCLFAEGSRFTEEKHKKSIEFAKARGLPVLKHHLFPRTKGFSLLAKNLKGIVPAVYDITFCYREGMPSLRGVVNCESCAVDVLIRRVELNEVPTDTEQESSDWLIKLYQEKDEIYEYYQKNRTFPTKYGVECPVPQRPWAKVVVVTWCLILGIPFLLFSVHLVLTGAWWTLAFIVLGIVAVNLLFELLVWQTAGRSKHGA
jgi:lysophosphatidic acid acyltransferase/lysophosphatidylinositol acyltransferase